MRRIVILLAILFYFTLPQAFADDWPQVGKDPQHSGYSDEVLGTNIKVSWTHPFQPERIYPQVQAIAVGNHVYVGTEMGHLYAIDTSNGNTAWVYPSTGNIGPILSSVAYYNGLIYVASIDGFIYALRDNGTSTSLIWRQGLYQGQINSAPRLGFSTSPIVADDGSGPKVFLGGRDSYFYALDANNGSLAWSFKAGAPLLQTAAYNSGKVFFGGMDMKVYALNTSNGSAAWTTFPQLEGQTFKDYWPVVTQGRVIIVPQSIYSRGAGSGYGALPPNFNFIDSTWLSRYSSTLAAGNMTQLSDMMNAQDALMSSFQANPSSYHLVYVSIDENTGNILPAAQFPHDDLQQHNGGKPPPCVDRDHNLIIPVAFANSGWGRVNLTNYNLPLNRYVDILYDGTVPNGSPYTGGWPYPQGVGNDDENMAVSCTQNAIITLHAWEESASYNGVFYSNYPNATDTNGRKWIRTGQGQRNRQMFNNAQGGGNNPATISNGIIYHISVHELVARSTN